MLEVNAMDYMLYKLQKAAKGNDGTESRYRPCIQNATVSVPSVVSLKPRQAIPARSAYIQTLFLGSIACNKFR